MAAESGGAIYLVTSFIVTFQDTSNVAFYRNSAKKLGGAIYGELIGSNQTKIISNNTADVVFHINTALVGNDVYMYISPSCDETCLNSSIVGLDITHNNPPRHIVLYDPAICISINQTNCQRYFLSNVMLGQDIETGACVLSYFDQHADETEFVVTGNNQNYTIEGSIFVSISCKKFEGIGIIGNKVSNRTNFSLSVTSFTSSESEISIEIIIEVSPCHPGFVHYNGTQKCACYNSSDIVSCVGSESSIKRGYWFGVLDDKPTVSICPNDYCNFTCCETTNGFYRLSPVRTNQCSSHRSGTACGSCEEGYTLSFDSAKCVGVNKCTTRSAVLLVTLSMIYWIVIVILVFIMTYYNGGIGYLYVITYYYSVVDILLNQMYLSQGLFTTLSIISSIAKITPQFLGQLCLVENMSGIDQQFIHYAHPLAVTIILAIICQSARISYRISTFVSRGIIHVICYLLLLSYTSVATTSLLLLRSLTFQNVDKVYTYLSPDIQYFHDRHLPYAIIAILCTLVIVIGLPLLLLLEPFLNHKINFTRIKPLLDQFQGCYKDKYRSCAAYYMICRLVIILIVIVCPSNNNTTQALIVAASTILASIQLLLRPYFSDILNTFDGMILHLTILISLVPFADQYNSELLITISFTLVILPLILFSVMELVVNKYRIKRIVSCFRGIAPCFTHKPAISCNNIDIPMSDITIIDDSARRNATICVM